MRKNTVRNWHQIDILVALIVLAFLSIYTYALLFIAPYQGFYFNPTDGAVLETYLPERPLPRIEVGDIIENIGKIPLTEYQQNRNLQFFDGIREGQIIEIRVRRGTRTLSIPWEMPGFNQTEFFSRFFNVWWLAYLFWLIGMTAQLHLRPKDTQWLLYVASNYLISIFIMMGSNSSFRTMGSMTLLRVAAWLLLPLYIHFHWIFPVSFRRIPGWLKWIFYVVFLGIAAAEFLQWTSGSFYFLAVILAFGGSILLLISHYILQPAHRREVRFLAVAAFLALFPAVLIGVVSSIGQIPHSGPLALLVLPILPGAYFYVLYRRSLGGLEFRTNRAISVYVFLVILGSVLLLIVGASGFINITPEAFLFAAVLMSLLTTFISIRIFPAFQSFVERRLLGIKLPAQNMVENFSARIVTSTTSNGLLKLLEADVFPSLFIRQYAFVQTANASAEVILSQDVDLAGVRGDALKDFLASTPTGRLIPPSTGDPRFGWVRLILPLKIEEQLIGAWLLGRRDPDDHYPQAELPVLQSLANQTAVALSYTIQTERLKVMYEANINRYEHERLRLGHELHDSLLNEMAAMLMKHDPDALPREFQESFDGLIVRLREIVSDLRPPMLTYGLKYALDGLADNLSERTHDAMQIVSEIQAIDDCRYPEIVEHNIYRIVQEACENALKYARAKSIHINGRLFLGSIELQVADDGTGFRDEIRPRLNDMVANKHFGLAGMHERAELIGAAINIHSQPGEGTQIQILWEAKSTSQQ